MAIDNATARPRDRLPWPDFTCYTYSMSFDPIARFYDLDDGRLTDDIPLYLGFARKTGGPALELGVGSARLALPLASAGFEVTGIDVSGEMLALARERIMRAGLRDRVRLIQADFTTPPLQEAQFALAYCGYNAFLHLIDGYDQRRALTAWRRALRPGGLLVIDVENPQLEALAGLSEKMVQEETLLDEDSGRGVRKFIAAWADLPDQILHLHRVYETNDGRWETAFQMRILFQRELVLLLACAGYNEMRFYGDYELNPWEPDSPRLIAVAAKPETSVLSLLS